jgi:hypothetical protein
MKKITVWNLQTPFLEEFIKDLVFFEKRVLMMENGKTN